MHIVAYDTTEYRRHLKIGKCIMIIVYLFHDMVPSYGNANMTKHILNIKEPCMLGICTIKEYNILEKQFKHVGDHYTGSVPGKYSAKSAFLNQ